MQIARFPAVLLAALALGLCGCKGREAVSAAPAPPRAQILREVPVAFPSSLRDTTGTSDAERRTYVTVAPFDSTAAFYRTRLPRLGWELLSDRTDRPAGKIDLYARNGNWTLWVHIEKQAELTTEYTLIASAAADSSGAAAPERKADGPR